MALAVTLFCCVEHRLIVDRQECVDRFLLRLDNAYVESCGHHALQFSLAAAISVGVKETAMEAEFPTIPGIVLDRKLGRGGFGAVWHGWRIENGSLGTECAVKVLSNLYNSDSLARFAREIKILSAHINNRFVVDIFDYDINSHPPYIVMEYCNQGSLRAWVTNARPWRDVMAAIAHVVQGIQGIHQVGGFHRDIKPDNILVSSSPQGIIVKVADFGLARDPEVHASMTNHPAGTTGYMAPEIQRDGGMTQPADIYSLGVTTLELLTGSMNPDKLARLDIPDPVRNLVYAMINTIPARRPTLPRIASELEAIIRLPSPKVAAAPAPKQQQEVGLGEALLAGGLLVGGIAALLGLMAVGNDKTWDDQVGRYRGPDGRFKR